MSLGSGLALVLASTMVSSPASATSDVQGDGLQYVALGDSYSAGFGLTPYSTSDPADGCYQAEKDYPHLVAAELGLRLTDVTCSNAVTANITTTAQNTGVNGGIAPIQTDALNADTDIVTVTIGGNDLGFSAIAASCLALAAGGPLMLYQYANDCKQFYQLGGNDVLEAMIATVVTPALAKTYKAIAEKAPNAKVFVVGYPAVAPDAANTPENGCFASAIGNGLPPYPENSYPFTNVDVPYLHTIESALDTAISQQAALAGATFIPTISQTVAHTPCAPQGEAYMSGITFKEGSVVSLPAGQVPPPVPPTAAGQDALGQLATYLKIGALHPNAAGVAFLKEQVATAILDAFPELQPQPSPAESPVAVVPPGSVVPAGSAAAPTLAASGSDLSGGLALAGLLLVLGAAAVGLRRRVRVRR